MYAIGAIATAADAVPICAAWAEDVCNTPLLKGIALLPCNAEERRPTAADASASESMDESDADTSEEASVGRVVCVEPTAEISSEPWETPEIPFTRCQPPFHSNSSPPVDGEPAS